MIFLNRIQVGNISLNILLKEFENKRKYLSMTAQEKVFFVRLTKIQ